VWGLHICYTPNNGQACINTRNALPLNQWTTVKTNFNNFARTFRAVLSGAVSENQIINVAGAATNNWNNMYIWAGDPW
jgi:hypothetical protein